MYVVSLAEPAKQPQSCPRDDFLMIKSVIEGKDKEESKDKLLCSSL